MERWQELSEDERKDEIDAYLSHASAVVWAMYCRADREGLWEMQLKDIDLATMADEILVALENLKKDI